MAFEGFGQDAMAIREISPAELKERAERGDPLVLVDVREPFERHIADLPDYGQKLLPVKQIPFARRYFDPETEMVLYCRSGQRSAWAVRRLMDMGFSRVYNLRGGIMAWRAEVDPSVRVY